MLPEEIKLLQDRLAVMSKWGNNWDAEGSEAPRLETFPLAAKLIDALVVSDAVPYLCLTPLGKPMLIFTRQKGEIIVTSAASIDYYFEGLDDDDTTEITYRGGELPENLRKVLEAV